MEEINFQMFTLGQYLKKNCDFYENLKFLSSFLLRGITIIKISSLFLPYRKALCTSVLVYPFSSFLILFPRFEESFLCRSLRREKQMGRILFWSTLPVATNFDVYLSNRPHFLSVYRRNFGRTRENFVNHSPPAPILQSFLEFS